jgi:uncharacterized protein (TIGR00369 family)
MMPVSRLEEVREGVLAHPLHAACGLRLIEAGEGRSLIGFDVNGFSANPQGALHGGVIYAMVDVACFFAVVPSLRPDQHPVSVECHVSILRAATVGETITIEARLDRLGRTLAAMRAEVFAGQGESRRLVATGSITKAILEGRGH